MDLGERREGLGRRGLSGSVASVEGWGLWIRVQGPDDQSKGAETVTRYPGRGLLQQGCATVPGVGGAGGCSLGSLPVWVVL